MRRGQLRLQLSLAPERWDVLDEAGRPTGRLAVRGEALPEGGRHLVAHVYLVDGEGRWLIQKRSMTKELWPGLWDITGGAVLAGEDARTGALREVREELGLELDPGSLDFIARLTRPDIFVDVWLGRITAGLDAMTPQPEEVDELRFVSAEELLELITFSEHPDDGAYRALVEDRILGGTAAGVRS